MSVTSRAGEGDAIPEASAKARQNLALALRKQFISMRLLSPESSPASFHAANWAELDDTLALYQAVNASIISFYKEEFDLSLGPSIKAFAENAKVDALIFVYAESAVPTAGMVTLQVLSMVPNYAGPIMLGSTKVGIAIVDGMNGDLLWHVSNQGTQIFPSDFEACAQACTHLVALMLKDFPKLKIVEP